MSDLVSIIVPVYNVRKYIIDTITSVQAQSYENWELLLIEDGSTDGTAQLIAGYLAQNKDDRIRLHVLGQNGGAAAARNYGIRISRGRFIAFLDSDDIWKPDKLKKQIAFMLKKQAAFCFTGYEFASEAGIGTGKVVTVPETIRYRQALQNTTIFTSTVIFDTNIIDRERIRMPEVKSEDTALWWKMLKAYGQAFGLNENLVLYRRGGKSLSSNKVEALRRIWNLYRNVEHLNIIYSAYNFFFWAVRAVKRRV